MLHILSIDVNVNVNNTITLAVIMDTIWFQQALERAGASQADLARHLRLAASAVSRML
jgi:ribosome-binding protein aMBF1 (putative translation factor)